MHSRSAVLLVLLVATACGSRVSAPSLAPRPNEARSVDLPDPEREVQTPIDPAIADRLAAATASADQGDAAFAAARGGTERAVAAAAGAGQGSEAWVVAQQALSNLDVARGPVREASAAIAALRQEPGAAGTGSRAAIDAAAAHVDGLEAAEADAVSALARRLR